MLGKLGELLNKDMGALVKDAGKVLNTDVAALAKDAGKVLNTDVATLAKGAGKVLNADLGAMLRDAEPGASREPAEGAAPAAKSSSGPASVAPPAQRVARAAATAAPSLARPAAAKPSTPPSGFDPDATLELGPGNAATAAVAPGGAESSSGPPQLSDDLVSRHRRTMPTGTSLLQLLPYSAGEFERPHAAPVGELTSDPAMAMYSVAGHPVAVRLVQCWDEDEARERLNEVKVQAGNNCRIGDDGSWILGETLQGLVFAWTRGNYSFTATAPKGAISMVRFLTAFPY